jgi:NADPH:quinone reductase-like Zn-dependent oxidoreductase
MALLLLVLGGPAAAAPTMMTALHKKGLSCFTPFRCISSRQVPTPTPGEGQALVKVAASSVNPCDVDYIELGFGCKGAAGTLGMDLAGTVVGFQDPQSHRGRGACARLGVGDAVWADGPKTGAMAEYAVVSCEQAGFKPKTLNLTEAGTIPLVGFTALEMWLKTGAPFTAPNLTAVVTSGTGALSFSAASFCCGRRSTARPSNNALRRS